LSRSATSAKLTTPASPGIAGRSSRADRADEIAGADVALLGVIDPVTTMPTMNETQAVNPMTKPTNRLVIVPTL
jgi:hypothetical protein